MKIDRGYTPIKLYNRILDGEYHQVVALENNIVGYDVSGCDYMEAYSFISLTDKGSLCVIIRCITHKYDYYKYCINLNIEKEMEININ